MVCSVKYNIIPITMFSYMLYILITLFLNVVLITCFNFISTAVCDELSAIANGGISYVQSDLTPDFGVGTVATYSCLDGYQLITNPGDEMRTCVDGGDGNGGVFEGAEPRCERKTSYFNIF